MSRAPIESMPEYLGYPKDARLLIVNGDDVGMCAAANAATFEALDKGILTSTTLMVPCPWARAAMVYLAEHPKTPFGVHLTTTAEWETYRWGSVLSPEAVPSLLDEEGCFYQTLPEFFGKATSDDVRREFAAQLQMALDAGLTPTHLDSHMGNYHLKEEFFDIARALAAEHDLLMRIGYGPRRDALHAAGIPAPDALVFDTYRVQRENKFEFYRDTIRAIKPGVTELVVHLGHDTPELRAISENWWTRVTDWEFCMDPGTRDFLAEQGVELIGYSHLLAAYRQAADS